MGVEKLQIKILFGQFRYHTKHDTLSSINKFGIICRLVEINKKYLSEFENHTLLTKIKYLLCLPKKNNLS